MNNFYIKEFLSVLKIEDKKGNVIVKKKREYSSIVFTFKGKIKFSNSTTTIYSDENTAVYLPKNSSYVNRCLEDADSYMFTFYDSNESDCIENIKHLDIFTVLSYYSLISTSDKNTNKYKIMSVLYSILDQTTKTEHGNIYVKKATKYIIENYSKKISVNDIADHVSISNTYLSKLFQAEYNTSVFKFLTKVRMEKAFMLIKENRQISEVALSVGYNDIYQFSRAYKKYYGKSPKNYR